MAKLSPEAVEDLRRMAPSEVFETARRLAFRAPGGGGSDSYVDLLEEMVAQGLLTWDEIEVFEERARDA